MIDGTISKISLFNFFTILAGAVNIMFLYHALMVFLYLCGKDL